MNRIIVLLSVFLLVSCTKSLDIQLEPQVDVFFSDDSEQKIRLTQEDNEYRALNEWLIEHKSNWLPTSGPYPGGLYIKSGSYGIQITKTHVVLYSTTGYKPKSIYIQNLEKGQLSGIRNIGQ